VILSAMGSSCEEEQRVDLTPLLEIRDEAICERFAGFFIDTQMMSFINDDQVPGIGVEEPLACPTTIVTQRVEGCDHHRSGRPEISALRVRLRDVTLEPDVEHVLEAKLPLRDELRRGKDHYSAHSPRGNQGQENKATFDCLAQPHVVGDQPAERPLLGYFAA